ncbi:uncharacterized protein LOC144164880 [Haemaphysalis longicornis]
MGKMPIIDAPFELVAVDIIGPLSPTSNSGKRYILTLVEFATRYADAVASKNVDLASVAEGLLEMFSRVGFPREILCDRSSTFTSDLMREVNYLLHVRGPLTLMKELWTKEEISSEIKTTYQYILEFRERLEATTELAHERLREAQKNQKGHYNMRSSRRQLKVGDKALLLLPTSHNKLLLHWKGPFPVIEKRNEVDYLLDLEHKKQLFHLNMLKPYKERDPGPRSAIVATFMAVDEYEAEQALPMVDVKEQRRVEDVAISEHLTSEEQLQIREILKKHSNLFSNKPGQTSLVHCHLKLTTDVPVITPQYPIPFALKEVAEAEVQEMLKLGIAEKSTSPYNSPLVLVKKPDGSYRICIDFRRLNSVLVADREPIPRTDVVFAEVRKKRYFSKFDLVKGYWQVLLTESSKEKTAFSTSSGHYQFRFMPFGIKTASAVFTRLMSIGRGQPCVHEGRVLFNRESLEHGAPQGSSIRDRAPTYNPCPYWPTPTPPRLTRTDRAIGLMKL